MYVGLKQPRGDGERYVTPATQATEDPTNRKARNRTLSLVYSSASACDSDNAVCDRKRRSHKQNQCSVSDSVGLIFTRSYRFTLLITTPTTTPSLVKTSLKWSRQGV